MLLAPRYEMRGTSVNPCLNYPSSMLKTFLCGSTRAQLQMQSFERLSSRSAPAETRCSHVRAHTTARASKQAGQPAMEENRWRVGEERRGRKKVSPARQQHHHQEQQRPPIGPPPRPISGSACVHACVGVFFTARAPAGLILHLPLLPLTLPLCLFPLWQ